MRPIGYYKQTLCYALGDGVKAGTEKEYEEV